MRRFVHWYICSLFLGFFLFNSGTFAAEVSRPVAIDMSGNLANSQQKQANNSCPKENITPSRSAFDRVPIREEAQDYLQLMLAIGAVFLLGLKLGMRVNHKSRYDIGQNSKQS